MLVRNALVAIMHLAIGCCGGAEDITGLVKAH
eukprot:CAMPEP_0172708546 /NCGR_PEP_ID=MMETSP1074-20121228/51330_1 /TAXON_ID=2916 /ORGANISM="Ceratium fusus, Strain PA161109" /LENGTH=31 /DNA_ID= /DNA_START= /DNA_END= /DNA_ORIENTATION=